MMSRYSLLVTRFSSLQPLRVKENHFNQNQ